jgi:hypothetical protein
MRSAVVKLKNEYYYCVEAIGGRFYNRLATILDEQEAKRLISGPQDERIIVFISERDWLVTMKKDVEGVKPVWVRCSTFVHAEKMRDHP